MHYSVDAIEARRVCPDSGTVQYLLKWEGYDAAFNSWEPRRHLVCSSDTVIEADEKEADAAHVLTSQFVARHHHRGDGGGTREKRQRSLQSRASSATEVEVTSSPSLSSSSPSSSTSKEAQLQRDVVAPNHYPSLTTRLHLVVHDHAMPPLPAASTCSTALEHTNPLLLRTSDDDASENYIINYVYDDDDEDNDNDDNKQHQVEGGGDVVVQRLQRLESLELPCGETMLLAVEHRIRSTLTAASSSSSAAPTAAAQHAEASSSSKSKSKSKLRGCIKPKKTAGAVDAVDEPSAGTTSAQLQHEKSWSTCHTEGLYRLACVTQRTAWWHQTHRSDHDDEMNERDESDICSRYPMIQISRRDEATEVLAPKLQTTPLSTTQDDDDDEDSSYLPRSRRSRRRRVDLRQETHTKEDEESPVPALVDTEDMIVVAQHQPLSLAHRIEVVGLVPAWAYRSQFYEGTGGGGGDDDDAAAWLSMLQDDELVVLYSVIEDGEKKNGGDDDDDAAAWLSMLQDDELVVLYSVIEDGATGSIHNCYGRHEFRTSPSLTQENFNFNGSTTTTTTTTTTTAVPPIAVLPMPLSMFRELHTQELLDYLLHYSLVMTSTTPHDASSSSASEHESCCSSAEDEEDMKGHSDDAYGSDATSMHQELLPQRTSNDGCNNEDTAAAAAAGREAAAVVSVAPPAMSDPSTTTTAPRHSTQQQPTLPVTCCAINSDTGFKCRDFVVTVSHTYEEEDNKRKDEVDDDAQAVDNESEAIMGSPIPSSSPPSLVTIRRIEICSATLYSQKKGLQQQPPRTPPPQTRVISEDGGIPQQQHDEQQQQHQRRCKRVVAFGLDVCAYHHKVASVDTSLRCVAVIVGSSRSSGDSSQQTGNDSLRCQLPVVAGQKQHLLCPYHFGDAFHHNDGVVKKRVKRDSGRAYKRNIQTQKVMMRISSAPHQIVCFFFSKSNNNNSNTTIKQTLYSE
ncbi:Hypothetical protein, putative [Bodo saltans]|uniref:Chromo domain-containing protein n=1 Tax=Bodo saltans TaxID=75058 RepID=A0A0S4ILM1_BODSA|nr:Hypothetical protein, putative [Bodo saltans]|eukprot:CUE71100.1 Hypothetical protein, putative [Bodo saltans]